MDQTAKLVRELESDPRDRGLLAVLADHLQQLGDPRGELIVLELTASPEQVAMDRRRALCIQLAPAFDSASSTKTTWGLGFIRAIEMKEPGPSLAAHAGFAHPSCRLLESLTLGSWHRLGVTIPDGVLPRSLRTLILRDRLSKTSDLSGLPHLDHLLCMDAGRLIHPTLRSLTLSNPSNQTLDALAPDELPALRTLTIEKSIEPFLDRIASLLPQLTELVLEHAIFDDDSYAILETTLAGHRLARLAIEPWRNPSLDRDRLAALADELVIPASNKPAAAGTYVTHAKFGRGQVLREFDGKLEIAFSSGKRTLKDGPYLKRSRD